MYCAPDVCSNTGLLALLSSSVHRNQDSRMGSGLLRVEVLDQCRVRVEVGSRRVPETRRFSVILRYAQHYSPADDNLLRIHLVVQLVHRPMVLHIYSNLFVRLAMENGKGRSDFYLVIIPDTEQSSNDTVLSIGSAEVVVEDGEEGNGVDGDIGRRASM